MKLLTGLFRAARKRLMTTDNDMGMFRDKLMELVTSKDKLSDEEVAAKVDELKGFTADLPGDEDKAKLDRFLDDFKAVKEQDEAAAKEAAGMVADLFEKLDTAAMKDVPEPEEEAAPAEEPAAAEAAPEEAPAPDAVTEEIVEETTAPAETEEKTEDAEPEANAEYTLEEIYQFIKKRMAEDAACQDEDPEAEEEVEEEEKDEEDVVTDHAAPFIPVTVNNTAQMTGSLHEMFMKAKNGGR
ncbi:MAG: hypothetical protein IIZ93_09175 [Acidaminococcaceae bacterium]|nr:hypothetical protein [Acidaminococcaceae bacterium]